MEKRNIYKSDDVLIIGSFLMLIPAVYYSWPWLSGVTAVEDWQLWFSSAPEALGDRLVMVFASIAGALFAQVVGRVLRHRENQTRDILDTVMYMGTATVSQIAGNLSLSEGKVRKLAQRLARVKGLPINMEGDVITQSVMSAAAPPPPPREAPEAAFQQAEPKPAEESFESTGESSFEFGGTKLSPELQDYLKNDKSDLISKMDKLRRVAESGGNISVEELEASTPETEESSKKMKRFAILFFILFMTPLWPIALIAAIIYGIKQYKKYKDKGMVDLHFGDNPEPSAGNE